MPSLDRRLFLKLASAAAASPRLPLPAEAPVRILLPVNVCGSFGYVDSKGTLAVPARYEAALPFATDWAAVRRNGKWGYIGRNGRETLAPQYDEARNFRYNCSPVRVGNEWHFIRPDGSEAFPQRFELTRSFQDGRARVRVDGKWGFIDPTGRLVIPPFIRPYTVTAMRLLPCS
ncbi:WG repeat-containing protein [Terriglobus sp.]|uniref:WG repeat-containing protein n=1 Tax=Terriglobus sp. TaxID=1889013 RepID=UPI003AFFF4D4